MVAVWQGKGAAGGRLGDVSLLGAEGQGECIGLRQPAFMLPGSGWGPTRPGAGAQLCQAAAPQRPLDSAGATWRSSEPHRSWGSAAGQGRSPRRPAGAPSSPPALPPPLWLRWGALSLVRLAEVRGFGGEALQ